MNNEEEIWREIPGLLGRYEASNFGQIRSVNLHGTRLRGKILSQQIESDGRLRVSLHVPNGKWNLRRYLAHKLVMLAFIGECPEGHEVNHIDGNHRNNHLSNLEYITKRANYDHAIQNGLSTRGTKNGLNKLSETQVQSIRARLAKGESKASIARSYGVTNTLICNIEKGKVWGWLSCEVEVSEGENWGSIKEVKL